MRRELHHVIMTSSVKSCRWQRHKADLCSSSHSSSSPPLANLQSLLLSLCEISPRALIYSPQLIHKEPITTISTISKPIKTISNSNLNCAKLSPSERNDSCFCFFTKEGPDKKNMSVLKAGRGWSENMYDFTFHLKPFYVLCVSLRLFFTIGPHRTFENLPHPATVKF